MTPPKQKPRRLTELYKDLLEVEKKQQEFAKQKVKFIKELNTVQSQLEELPKEVQKNNDQKQRAILEGHSQKLQEKMQIAQRQLTETTITISKIQNQNNSLEGQIKETKAKLNQHITNAQNSKNKELLEKAKAAKKELDSYDKLVKKPTNRLKKVEEKIKSDYIKERDNLFESVQNICTKTEQITPAVKEILEIDFTKKASKQKLTIAKAAAKALTTGLDNSVTIAKIVTSANYYVKEAKKIDIADRAKTEDSFFVKLLSDGKTQELLKNTLPQINKVAKEVAPLLVSKTLDYLEKTGKKYEKQEAKTKDFAARKENIILQVAEHSEKNQKLPKELQQKFDVIKKEEEAISKDNTSAKQSSIRQSLGKTISALKNRGFDDEHINDTFVPIMSSVIHNASNKPQEVTGAIKAVVDLGLAANSQEQAKAVAELLLSEIVRDTLKDQAIQNLATNQTGFITATIQEIVKNNNSLKERAGKIGVTDDSIKDLTEMATGVITTGLKFGGKLLDGLSNERDAVEKVIDVTIQTGKKVAKIIDDNKELKAEHIAVITDELKVVADNALKLMNRESVQGVIKELGADIAQDKELPKIIKQGVKTIAKIAAPNVTKLGNFNTVVDFAVDLGVNITSAGLKGADEVNSLVRNTVLPVATSIAIIVLKNTDKINELAKQVKDITEESTKEEHNNSVEKATNAINNGLEVASNVMNLLNDGDIKESLTQNLNKLGKDLQSATYVEKLVTTVAQNILPTSEIIGDRDTVNRVIADTAILAEKTAAAVLSEEKNITAVFDGATHGIAVAKSLLSSDKQTVATADSISKVVESAAVLLTDENVSKVISEKIPDYIAMHGQTFMDVVTSQFATRQAKKAASASEEVLITGEVVLEQTVAQHEIQQETAEIIAEQSAASDEVQVTDSEAAPNNKSSSKEKAIEVVSAVAKNVTNIFSILQSEEGRKSKEAIVDNLGKLGDQIREQKYIQNIAPKIIEPILQIEALKPLKDSGITKGIIEDTSVVAEQIIGIALKNADAAIDIANNVAKLAQNYAPVVTGKKPDNFDEQQQALQGVDSLSHILEGATKLLTDKEMSRVITGQIPGYIELHGANIISAAVQLVETFTNKENKEQIIKEQQITEVVNSQVELNDKSLNLVLQDNVLIQKEEDLEIAAPLNLPERSDISTSSDIIAEQDIQKNNKVSSKEKALEIAKDAARGAVNFFNALQSEEGQKSKEEIVGNLSKLGDQISEQGYIQKIMPKVFDSLISLEKQTSLSIQEKSADSMLENQPKPSDNDHQKDPMTPEKAKITLQDIITSGKSIKDIKNISQFVQDSSAVTEQIVSIALQQSDAAINIATSLIALGQDAAQALAKTSASSEIKDSELNDKKMQIVAHDSKLVAVQSNILADNILIIARDPAIQDLVTKELPSYIQGNKDTILAITKQLTGQYQAQIGAIGLSEEVINQTADLSVKLLTDKNIAPIYELVGNVVNNAGMSSGGTQSDIALLIDHLYNAAINKDNKEARKEIAQNAINKIGDIIFSANTHDQVRAVVTQNIPRLLRENERAIAGLAEEFLERTKVGQKISSRISIDVERALKVAEKKSGTLLSLLENYHKKNYAGMVKNVIYLATSPKVIKFLGATAARTIHMKIKGSHVDRVNKRRPLPNQRGC